jgi:hypothetical protein
MTTGSPQVVDLAIPKHGGLACLVSDVRERQAEDTRPRFQTWRSQTPDSKTSRSQTLRNSPRYSEPTSR